MAFSPTGGIRRAGFSDPRLQRMLVEAQQRNPNLAIRSKATGQAHAAFADADLQTRLAFGRTGTARKAFDIERRRAKGMMGLREDELDLAKRSFDQQLLFSVPMMMGELYLSHEKRKRLAAEKAAQLERNQLEDARWNEMMQAMRGTPTYAPMGLLRRF